MRAFLSQFENIVSPAMLEWYFQLIFYNQSFRFVASSGINRELHKHVFNNNDQYGSIHHLYLPWWISHEWENKKLATKSEEIQDEEEIIDEDFTDEKIWQGSFEDFLEKFGDVI